MASDFLPPGFRFHPTDVELVQYYLKRKVLGKRLHYEAISEVDMYKFAPWDLPDKACLKSRDLEWYFFCPQGRKYGTGQRVNRSTDVGYWKTTGKDRSVYYDSRIVGMKKTLIFHIGKAPHGDRTDWVVYEYRLEDKQLAEGGIAQGSYVLCKLFKKSGLGSKNGEQYGAPFIEEEWDDDAGTEGCRFASSCAVVNQVSAFDVSSREIQNAQAGNMSNPMEDPSIGEHITTHVEAPSIQETIPVQMDHTSIKESTSIQWEDPIMRFLCQVLADENDPQVLQEGATNYKLPSPARNQAFALESLDLYNDMVYPPACPKLHPVNGVSDSSFLYDDLNLESVLLGLSVSEMDYPEMYHLGGSYVEINDLWDSLGENGSEPVAGCRCHNGCCSTCSFPSLGPPSNHGW